ncbi:MAG TPA: DUF3667 domain-containing protein [Longimicrobiaceae bacterium]|jgi:hypothetical protein|nr:DUF3667 domain-containing protein [Longimicrobiaceae bacterium]
MRATHPDLLVPVHSAEIAHPAAAGPAEACLNCGAGLTGDFCARCGQAARTGRLRFDGWLREFGEHLLTLDFAVVHTFGALLRRPGGFVRAYLDGRRVGYTGPLRYYLLVVALNIAASTVLSHGADAPEQGGPDEGFWDGNFVALQIGLLFGLLMLPLAGAQRALDRRAGYTLAEHYAFLLYVLAQSVLGMIALRLVLSLGGMPFEGDPEGLAWLALFTGYLLWARSGFVEGRLWRSVLKTLLAYAAVAVCVMVVGGLAVAVFGTP